MSGAVLDTTKTKINPARPLTAALCDPEQGTQLSHAQTPDPQRPGNDRHEPSQAAKLMAICYHRPVTDKCLESDTCPTDSPSRHQGYLFLPGFPASDRNSMLNITQTTNAWCPPGAFLATSIQSAWSCCQCLLQKCTWGISLAIQWLGLPLPMQGPRGWSLVGS